VYQRGSLGGLAIVVALVAAIPTSAHEPDGRVVIRYDWPEAKAGESGAPKLRLTLTAVVNVTELRLVAKVPLGIGLSLRAAGSAAVPWPDEGLSIGDLPAGRSIVVELDVGKPASGGGIVGFALHGVADGHTVLDGVGIPVGVPGVQPTLRNGALEFPAAQADPSP
jgi:hypothetical protein